MHRRVLFQAGKIGMVGGTLTAVCLRSKDDTVSMHQYVVAAAAAAASIRSVAELLPLLE